MTISKYIVLRLFIALLTCTTWMLQAQKYGAFDKVRDVGPVLHKGETVYEPNTQTYRLTGAGANIWFAKDEFHYTYRRLKSDFILQARGRLIGPGGDPHRKFGWMIRTSLDTNAVMVCAAVHGDGLTSLQYRKEKGGNVEEVKSIILMPDVIQLERKGNSFFLSVAHTGRPFWTVELPDLVMPDSLYAGLFICAHNNDTSETAIFENVRMITPAQLDFTPYEDYIGSHLEILNVTTGMRKVLYSTPDVIQAPNWHPNGKSLIYNKEGLIYTYDIESGVHTEINTSFVNGNNNDHVLSFDGKMFGLSGGPDTGEVSFIYTVPLEGGTPLQITPKGPSYLHGWSPDGQWLIYTGLRSGEYDLYKISSTGGPEVRLTTDKGLDDGSEYSPDGKYIYYNSVKSGKMELWRMTADGTEPTQLTDDEYQNWFPHISPDGKWICFLSFMPEVEAEDHPFYKNVYIRLMPAAGGNAKIIGYVYGGQGTINVPSWSPDSKYVAFVSNSQISKPSR